MTEQLELLSTVDAADYSAAQNRIAIRESTRARRMFLHVQPPIGIELVVPRGTRAATVQRFVETNRQWIERAQAQIAREYVGDRSTRPQLIEMPVAGRSIAVSYTSRGRRRRRWHMTDDRLEVFCNEVDCSDAAQLLRAWLMSEARNALPSQVEAMAPTIGVTPRRVQVRLQRTRWGSCSSSGTISVNAALMLLDASLIRYLIVHELCHMRHMNHSRAYWQLVRRHEPNFRRLDKALAQAWQKLPWWVVAQAPD